MPMSEILIKQELAPKIKLFKIHAPEIATKANPGQFIMLSLGERGERIPLTIVDYEPNEGSVTFVFNEVGKTTKELGCLGIGQKIKNVAGPLGNASDIQQLGTVLCVGGGVMNAPLHLQVRAHKKAGNKVVAGIGARTKDLLIFEEEMRKTADEVHVFTDDGSKGHQGLGFLDELLKTHRFQRVIVMGPVVTMMKVSEFTKPHSIPTVVTLTPIMVDGMGMCGACRVTIKGETMFACIDGPEFNGHEVDFTQLIERQRVFLPEERVSSLLWEKTGGECHEQQKS
jgi:ferredoxin--NADP+ reductase